jgi:TonB-dependent receptor
MPSITRIFGIKSRAMSAMCVSKIRGVAFCFFFIHSLCSLSAQETGTLVGQVVDENDLSLPGANIILPDLNMGAATDNNGEFRVSNVPTGQHTVRVLFIGFEEVRDSVIISSGASTRFDVMLKSGIVELDEVMIVGERLKGQAKALNQQKTNFHVSNVVSADQVGRFPDQNIGDALKRTAAISVNYNQGEARYANIRGTGPRLNSVSVDGEHIPSADGETRAVQLDLIPADMIQSIEVNKTITPDMDADAIGGSVNLVTRQVPHLRRLSATVGSGYNALSGKPMLNGAFVLGQRFYNDALGLIVSGSYDDHRLGSHNTEGLWEQTNKGEIYPYIWDIREYDIRRLRRSFSVGTDYRVSDDHRFFVNFMINRRDDWENRVRLRYYLENPKDGISEETEIRRQTKGGPNGDRFNNARLEDQRTNNISFKGKHNTDLLQIEWSFSHGRAWERRPRERYMSWAVQDVPVTVDASDPRTPYFYDDVPYEDFESREISEEYRGTEERDTRLKVDIDIPIIKKGKYKNTFYVGTKLKYKTKWRQQDFVRMKLTDAGEEWLNDMTQSDTENFSRDNFLAGDYQLGRFTRYDFLGALDFSDTTYFNPKRELDEYIAANYDANEDITSAYIMLDQQLGKDLDMKAGVRLEQTRIDYNGFAYFEDNKEAVKTHGADFYYNWLPGLHFKYEPKKNITLRLAWTNTLARPNYYDLVPYRAVSRGGDVLEIGNPNLRPTTSSNLDFMVEQYYESIGILSAGLFSKSIKNFIYIRTQRDYEDAATGNEYDAVFQPKNGAEADLFGLELSWQRQLSFLPGVLSHLGLYSNYTYIYSKANSPKFPQKNIKMPGAAPHTLNLNISYETQKLLLGLSLNYTSPYLDPDELDLTPGLERYYDKVTYLDFNSSYSFTPQVHFFLEANNLLNQPLRYYAGTPSRTYQQEFYNVRFTAGLKYDL